MKIEKNVLWKLLRTFRLTQKALPAVTMIEIFVLTFYQPMTAFVVMVSHKSIRIYLGFFPILGVIL